MTPDHDALVVGSGPNGLAAAVTLARAGLSVLVLEAADTPGGGTRSSSDLTLPGYVHDVCSAVHPLGIGSPFFSSLPLHDHGLEWVHGEVECAHPLDDGTAATLLRSVADTGDAVGDRAGWQRLLGPLARRWDDLAAEVLRSPLHVPRHPLTFVRFGLRALPSATTLARGTLRTEAARALFVGIAAHTITDLRRPLTAAGGLVLTAAGHAVGWPVVRGGSQSLADALVAYLEKLGGRVETGRRITSLAELPPARVVILDVTPGQLLAIAGDAVPPRVQRQLARFRHGPGSFKLDYALDGPIPWTAEPCRRAGTVHLGGTMDEIAAGEADVSRGRVAERPYVLVGQQSLLDDSRAPAGKHTAWVYCHVPHGSPVDMRSRVEAQLERFAPGFRDRVLECHTTTAPDLAAGNANYVGGDIAAGAAAGLQLLFRPRFSARPYATGAPGVYLCSASTPPGPGVHGMCGAWAARAALANLN